MPFVSLVHQDAGEPPVADAPLVLTLTLEAAGWERTRNGKFARRIGLDLRELSWNEELGLLLRSADGDAVHAFRADAGLRSELQPGEFGLRGDRLFVGAEDEGSPGRLELSIPLDEGGYGPDGRWRVRCGEVHSDGFLLSAEGPVLRRVPDGASGRLQFWASAMGLADASTRLRVLAGHEVLAEIELRVGAPPRFHRLDLAGAELRFEVVDAGVVVAVQAPGVAPVREDPRPDVFLFLADTFRADNLEAYGRDLPGLTPRLDAFAAEGVVFQRAWSSANWTLPSQASMLFGVHPAQHGATQVGVRVTDGLSSLATRLRDAGYRTAAFTDAVFVSHRYGLDEGFEWFRERTDRDYLWSLDATLGDLRRWLEAGDGRPNFVFIQSYRTHTPFLVSEPTRREWSDRLALDLPYEELHERLGPALLAALGEERTDGPMPPELLDRLIEREDWRELLDGIARRCGFEDSEELLDRVRANYLGGVHDLDQDFGRLLALLEEDRGREHYLAFVSDHGEAFGEHDLLFHGDGPWDAVLRVPCILSGPGLEPERRLDPASTVDLPRTLCGLVGVSPAADWEGRDLFGGVEAPVHAFDGADRGQAWAVLVDGHRKWLFPAGAEGPAATPRHAYDLDADPGEQRDLLPDLDPEAVVDEHGAAVQQSWRPRGEPRPALLSGQLRAQLAAMGYVDPLQDDDEDEDEDDEGEDEDRD